MNETYGRLNSISEARERLGGIGVSTIYNMMREGRVRAIKLGARTFIADAEIDRILHEANQAAAEKAAARRERGAA